VAFAILRDSRLSCLHESEKMKSCGRCRVAFLFRCDAKVNGKREGGKEGRRL